MSRITLLLLPALLAASMAQAADQPAELPPVKPGWTVLPDEVADAKSEALVNEDDNVRIEELRVRGQTRRIRVHLKNSVLPDYEILVTDGKYELTPRNDRGGTDGVRGTRVWSLFDY